MDSLNKNKESIKTTDHQSNCDWWGELPIKIKFDIQEAIQQADNGETLPHEVIKEIYAPYFNP